MNLRPPALESFRALRLVPPRSRSLNQEGSPDYKLIDACKAIRLFSSRRTVPHQLGDFCGTLKPIETLLNFKHRQVNRLDLLHTMVRVRRTAPPWFTHCWI